MTEGTFSMRRRMCLAAVLAAAGLHGCGAQDAGPEHAGQDAGPDAPADDRFRHAHVLASDYRQATDEPSSASPELSQSLSGGWVPEQFRRAYNVPDIQSNKPAGYGTKVAIIVAYHYANLQADLNTWSQHFNVRPITLNIINQAGIISSKSWALDAAISVQMINTVSPGATVYVIEAKSESQADMRTAMLVAQNLGVQIVSMSFGASEPGSQAFAAPFAPAPGMVWVAASGDAGRPSFPATHPGVIAVGGTVAQLDHANALYAETAWGDAGAGMSLVAAMPSFQEIPSVQTLNTTSHRSIPDVAFHANPNSGASIYSSINGGWLVVGGTSVSTAFFAGVVALASTSRRFQNKPMLSSVPGKGLLLQNSLYQLMSTNGGPTNSTILNDVVDGVAGEGAYAAGPGYDIATGLGSLDVQQFVDYIGAQ